MRRCPRSRLKQVDYSGLRILVHLDELVAGDTGLGADRPQGRPFDPWMIRHHTAMAVSAMNASRTMDSFSKTELPNVSAWNRTADLTSANASS